MAKKFKWNGNWQTVINNVPKDDILQRFGKPVTPGDHNLGVFENAHGYVSDCPVGDYVVKVGKHEYKIEHEVNKDEKASK